ncbi:MAG: trypsin-like peptidase domain-containing protein [Clostridia bacterium]|nr:trypsin-like peptidase domain-containing protein [Clostridia bacterium]
MKKNFKVRVCSIFILVFFVVSLNFSVSAQNKVKILVNGKEAAVEATKINNKVFVDVSALSSAIGAKASPTSNGDTVSITVPKNDDVIPEVIKSVSPCVVGIMGIVNEDSENKYSEGLAHGTGVIIKSGGDILTNAHVVKDMEKIVVVLADGTGYEARLKYIDDDTDLAVIKIDKLGLGTAKFGKQEEIVTGKTVIAIGTPVSFSLRNSASIGIISGLNRGVGSAYKLIQTDAAINPGNSGGPLVNLKGEVIGINSSKFSGTGLEGLGFSIPIDTVNHVLEHFYKYGKVKRPYLGAGFEEDWAARYGLPTNSGLKITEIDEESPADICKLRENDIVLSVNGSTVNTLVDFNEEMKKYLPQSKVTLKIKRGTSNQNINVVLGEN